jgi:hypothetical protein
MEMLKKENFGWKIDGFKWICNRKSGFIKHWKNLRATGSSRGALPPEFRAMDGVSAFSRLRGIYVHGTLAAICRVGLNSDISDCASLNLSIFRSGRQQ